MTIRFNRKIYKKKAIQSAIKDYKHLADFSIKQDSNYFKVELKNIDKDVEEIIKDEFSNYVLSRVK